MGALSAERLQELGLHDPRAPLARERLALLRYLSAQGATAEDLLAYADELPGLAAVVAIRGGSALSLAEAAPRAGISEERLLGMVRAAGLPAPAPGDRALGEGFAAFAAELARAEALFGEQAVAQLVRVMGAAMARLADAIVTAFLVNVDPGISEEDPVGLEVARANVRATELLPALGPGLDALLRQHLLAARRTSLGAGAGAGFETRALCVGFVDLVGSTALAARTSTGELGSALIEFENVCADVVTAAGGRLVKLIGDEVLYSASEPRAACAIALSLVAAFAAHPALPPARGGVAAGEVMLRDGDIFGPVVNLAARAVKAAAAGEVLAPAGLAAAAGMDSEPRGAQALKGFAEEIELYRLSPASPPPAPPRNSS